MCASFEASKTCGRCIDVSLTRTLKRWGPLWPTVILLSILGCLQCCSAFNKIVDVRTLDSSQGYVIKGAAGNNQAGFAVSNAGDVNGDAFPDTIVGAYKADRVVNAAITRSMAGAAYVIFGGSNVNTYANINTTLMSNAASPLGFAIFGAQAGDQSGFSVSVAGDFNGDSIADVIVGAPTANPLVNTVTRLHAGIAYVIFGRSFNVGPSSYSSIDLASMQLTGTTKGFAILGAEASDQCGYSLSGGVDINLDGLTDVIVGARYADPVVNNVTRSNAGIVYVVFGRSQADYVASSYANVDLLLINTAGSSIGYAIYGAVSGDLCGWSVAGGGDFNLDGYVDVIVGAVYADPIVSSTTRTDAGVTYVLFGRSYILGTNSYTNIDTLTFANFGSPQGFAILGAKDQDNSGWAVSNAGDINMDGVPDVIIGAFGADPVINSVSRSNAGKAYIVFGRAASAGLGASRTNVDLAVFETAATTAGFAISGAATGDSAGSSVSGAGDINKDGAVDVLIGAMNADPVVNGTTRTDAGMVYVVLGRTAAQGPSSYSNIDLALFNAGASSMGFAIAGGANSDNLGRSVKRAGDVNKDNVGDIIIGASGADATGVDSGAAYVLFGAIASPTSQPSSQPSSLPSSQPSSQPSRQPSAQPSRQPSGPRGMRQATLNQDIDLRALTSRQGFTIRGVNINDFAGYSVSSAGDMNHDGIADMLIGAQRGDSPYITTTTNSNTGITYVVFGRNVAGGASSFATLNLSSITTGTTAGFRILGAAVSDNSGSSVASLGDVNGDGVDDIILGAAQADPPTLPLSNAGISYVIFGRDVAHGAVPFGDILLSTIDASSTIGFRILGAAATDQSGLSVCSAGDINGDGINDIVIGAASADPSYLLPSSNAGIAYVIFGRDVVHGGSPYGDVLLSALSGSTAGYLVGGVAENDQLGRWVSPAGDVNGDDISDFIITAPQASSPAFGANNQAGVVYVIFGRNFIFGDPDYTDMAASSIVTGSSLGFRILGAAAGDKLGRAACAGDINGDHIGDIIVGANAAFAEAGASYVIFGRATGFSDIYLSTIATGSAVGFRMLGAKVGDNFGVSVSSAGDINGDGVDDIVVGAHLADPRTLPANSNAGITYVIFGRDVAHGAPVFTDLNVSTLMSGSTAGFRIIGGSVSANSGYSVSAAGDVNNDGVDDIIIGAPASGVNFKTGGAFVVFGAVVAPTSQPSSQPSRQPSSQPSRQPTSQPSCQPSRQPTRQPTSQPTSQPSRQPSGQPTRQPSGPRGVRVANLNQDLDLRSLSSRQGFTIHGVSAGDWAGGAVSSAGDVNGDGIGDFIVGVSRADSPLITANPNSNTGITYVVFGRNVAGGSSSFATLNLSSIATGSTAGFRILGAAENDISGSSVAGVGDVNGDCIDDLIVGAYQASSPGMAADSKGGVSYVIFGRNVAHGAPGFADILLSTISTSPSVGFRIIGAAAGDQSGTTVASAGDINGDGINDILLGAPFAVPPGQPISNIAGVAYVIYGRNVAHGASPFGDILLSTIANSTLGFRIDGAVGSQLGRSACHAGDVNGDGIDDIIVPAFFADNPALGLSNRAGIIYVIFGRNVSAGAPRFTDIVASSIVTGSSLGFRILGAVAGDRVGRSAAAAGDVNGDGIADIIVGSFTAFSSAGASYVIFGRNVHGGASPFEDVLLSVLSSGSTVGFSIVGATAGDSTGQAVSSAGDLNGDGIKDLLVGGYFANPPGLPFNSKVGIAYVIFGRDVAHGAAPFTNLNVSTLASGSTVGFRILGPSAHANLGFAVSAVGDVNNDGVDDIIIGAPATTSTVKTGAAYVIYGAVAVPTSQPSSQPSRQPTSQPSREPNSQPSAQPSRQPSAQPTRQPSGPRGTRTGTLNQDVDLSTLTSRQGFAIQGASLGDYTGVSVSAAGDINGDGVADVIVGAQRGDSSLIDCGITYVIFGRDVPGGASSIPTVKLATVATGSTAGFRILGAGANDYSGYSVAAAGDVNGDGVDDLIVGAYVADPPTLVIPSNAGITFVIFGRNIPSGAPAFGDVELASIVTGSTLGFRIFGAAPRDNSGTTVASAGDVNGDGIRDIIIGAPAAHPPGMESLTNVGIAYVVFGRDVAHGASAFQDISLSDIVTNSTLGFRVLGMAASAQLGKGVSSAGDINGDGVDDIIVPASYSNTTFLSGTNTAGIVYVVYGRNVSAGAPRFGDILASSIVTGSSLGFRIIGAGVNDRIGRTTGAAGDVNGDGVADIIVGAANAHGNAGATYVIFGRKVGAGTPPFGDVFLSAVDANPAIGFCITGTTSGDISGFAVSSAGDVNGDGISDIIIGAYKGNSPSFPSDSKVGISYVIFGRDVAHGAPAFGHLNLSTIIPGSREGFRILGSAAEAYSGYSVSAAGDVNNDGVDDVIVGEITIGDLTRPGAAFVVYGSLSSPTSQPSSRPSSQPSCQPSSQPSSQPSIRPSRQPTSQPTSQPSSLPSSQPSMQPSGQPTRQPSGPRGVNTGALNQDIDLQTLTSRQGFLIQGTSAGDRTGYSVRSAGDVNGDGSADVIIGAQRGDSPLITTNSNSNTGISYVIFGRNVPGGASSFATIKLATLVTGSTAGFRILGAALLDYSGNCVAGVGDVNGDGVDDILVASMQADPPGLTADSNAGMSYVIFGRNVPGGAPAFTDILLSTIGSMPTIGFRILGAAAMDYSGMGVTNAGDVNGDGIKDMLIAAPLADPPALSAASNGGILYVLYGRDVAHGATPFGDILLSTITTNSTVGFRVLGSVVGGQLGRGASSAGDVNGDGIDDIIVCEPITSPAGLNSGTVYVIYGRNVSAGAPRFGDILASSIVTGSSLGFRILGAAAGDRVGQSATGDMVGQSTAPAGDVNGDGVADIIVSSASAFAMAGVSYVIFGRNVPGGAAPFEDILLSTFGAPSTLGFRIIGNLAGDASGWAVSSAGDVNGDGISDLLIGAFWASPPGFASTSKAGIGYVVFGRDVAHGAPAFGSLNLSTIVSGSSDGFRILGAASAGNFGTSVSAAGDTNNDGVDDIIIGAPAGGGSGVIGRAYVIFGAVGSPTSQPSSRPSSQPSAQPSMQPIVHPSGRPSSQPSSQPSGQPSLQPSGVPSSQPRAHPTTQPSTLPTTQPTTTPSTQPSAQPSTQPSSQPSGQPSRQPSCQPSSQPSCQPICSPSGQPSSHPTSRHSTRRPSYQPTSQPTSLPSCQPSAFPSSRPSGQPSSQPTIQPSVVPSTQPTSQPSTQPRSQPSQQPYAPPTGQPTSAPTKPTGPKEWATVVQRVSLVAELSFIDNNIWACGGSPMCSVLLESGILVIQYTFPWDETVTAVSVDDTDRLIIAGRSVSGSVVSSAVANCNIESAQLSCIVKSFGSVNFADASYNVFPDKVVFVGQYSTYAIATITDSAVSSVRSFIYTATNMKSLLLLRVQSPPSFIGSFVVGTCVRSVGASVNNIVVGWVRTDTGALSAMSLIPADHTISTTVGLVTAMALDSAGPDSIVTGGLTLNDNMGCAAYVVRANALYRSVQYGMRYRTVSDRNRRMLSDTATTSSFTKGVVLIEGQLYMIVDATSANTTHLAVIVADAATGLISKQTVTPTASPTVRPTQPPSARPSAKPSVLPSLRPTVSPSVVPSKVKPSFRPTIMTTPVPTTLPTTALGSSDGDSSNDARTQPVVIAVSVAGGVLIIGLLALFYYDRAKKSAKESKIKLLKVTPWTDTPQHNTTQRVDSPPPPNSAGVGRVNGAAWRSNGGSRDLDASYSDTSEDAVSEESDSVLSERSYLHEGQSSLSYSTHCSQAHEDHQSDHSSSDSCDEEEHSEFSVPIATAGRAHRSGSSHSHSNMSTDVWWQSVLDDMDLSAESNDEQ